MSASTRWRRPAHDRPDQSAGLSSACSTPASEPQRGPSGLALRRRGRGRHRGVSRHQGLGVVGSSSIRRRPEPESSPRRTTERTYHRAGPGVARQQRHPCCRLPLPFPRGDRLRRVLCRDRGRTGWLGHRHHRSPESETARRRSPSWVVGNGVFGQWPKSTSPQNRSCGSQIGKMTSTGLRFESFPMSLGGARDYRPPN
jgi:hypothetical protein